MTYLSVQLIVILERYEMEMIKKVLLIIFALEYEQLEELGLLGHYECTAAPQLPKHAYWHRV